MLKIGEFSRLSHLTVKALRFYVLHLIGHNAHIRGIFAVDNSEMDLAQLFERTQMPFQVFHALFAHNIAHSQNMVDHPTRSSLLLILVYPISSENAIKDTPRARRIFYFFTFGK